jgi:RNA polymerase sigma-70 factor (ECF subfamily)
MSAVPPRVSVQPLTTRPDRPPVAAAATDAELLRAVADGSDAAFEELRHRYQGAVERTCRSILRGGAEDCAQEAFVRIWQKARLFDPRRGSAAAWLMTLTRNVAYNLGAKEEPEPRELSAADVHVDDPRLSVDAFWLDAGLERLEPRERQVIELAYFADLSQTQIADRLGVPLGTVKSWTRRGLNRLAALLGEETGE